jgi:PDDEXK-like domain of unknown function (DUF3799)
MNDLAISDHAVRQAPACEAKDIALGITRGIHDADYHGERSAVSSTQLKRMLISPAHFLCGLNEPEESSEVLLYGSVLHGRLLEPETFARRFYAQPKVDRRTKEGKAAAAAHEVEAGGRIMFPADWLQGMDRIADNLQATPRRGSCWPLGKPRSLWPGWTRRRESNAR